MEKTAPATPIRLSGRTNTPASGSGGVVQLADRAVRLADRYLPR